MKISVRVKTGAKKEYVEQIGEHGFVVAVSARPERGKANEAVVRALAKYLKIPQWRVGIRSGHASRQKIIEIAE